MKRVRLWWRIGLIGVASMAFGSGWYQVWFGPPYRYVDEQAHAGYVLEVQAGRLPTIDTPIDRRAGGAELRERLDLEVPRRRDVWVANNPPVPYLAAAGPAAASRALGLPGGPLVGLRLANLVAMTLAVVISCRVGRALAGGDRRAGIFAGALTAAVPHTGFIAGMGMTDGFALLAVVGTIDAAVATRGRWTRAWWARLLAWASFGAAVRPMSAVLCAAVVVVALVVRWAARHPRLVEQVGGVDGRDSDSAGPERARRPVEPGSRSSRSANPGSVDVRPERGVGVGAAGTDVGTGAWVTAVVLGLVAAGWYVRNLVLYGDPTGSSHLFEKFERTPRSVGDLSLWSEGRVLVDTLFLRRLQNELDTDPLWLSGAVVLAVLLGVVGTFGLALAQRRAGSGGSSSSPDDRPSGGRVHPSTGRVRLDVAVLLCVVSFVNIAVVVQHWAGGGGLHPRYALLLVPVLGAFVGTVTTRWAGGAGALVVVAGALAVSSRQVVSATRWVNDHKTAPLSSPLTMSIGPQWWRLAGVIVVAVGFAFVAAALVGERVEAAWRTRGGEG